MMETSEKDTYDNLVFNALVSSGVVGELPALSYQG
jgi:hypothetical protein